MSVGCVDACGVDDDGCGGGGGGGWDTGGACVGAV